MIDPQGAMPLDPDRFFDALQVRLAKLKIWNLT